MWEGIRILVNFAVGGTGSPGSLGGEDFGLEIQKPNFCGVGTNLTKKNIIYSQRITDRRNKFNFTLKGNTQDC